jgi:cytochrome c553
MMFKKRFITLVPAMLALGMSAVYAADPIEGLARTCNNCHGDTSSAGGAMPSINGLSEEYLKNILLQWKKGERYSATMGRLVKGYSDEDLATLAQHISKQKWVPVAQKLDPAKIKRGKALSGALCAACHGDTGFEPSGDDTPKIGGQSARYLELELMKYRDDAVTMPFKKMRTIAKKLKDDDVDAVAQYFASQTK